MIIFDALFGICFLPMAVLRAITYIQSLQHAALRTGRRFKGRCNEVGYQTLKSRHEVPEKSAGGRSNLIEIIWTTSKRDGCRRTKNDKLGEHKNTGKLMACRFAAEWRSPVISLGP